MADSELTRSVSDARVVETRHLCLAAARRLLIEEGQQAVTPTRVSQLTGVSRSTIYRHWPTPEDLVYEASAADTDRDSVELTGDVRSDLLAILLAIATYLRSEGSTLAAGQIVAAEHSEQVRIMTEHIRLARRSWIAEAAQQPDDESFSPWMSLLIGPLFTRRFVTREDISDQFVELVVDAYLVARESAV